MVEEAKRGQANTERKLIVANDTVKSNVNFVVQIEKRYSFI